MRTNEPGDRTTPEEGLTGLTRKVVRHALAADVPFMAGAIAYQAFISILPLLFLLAVLVATLGDETQSERLFAILGEWLPRDARSLVRGAIRKAVDRTGNSIVGVVVLGFGSFAVFNGLDKAFTDLYGTDRGANLPNQLRDAGVVLAALGAAVLVIVVSWPAVAWFESLPFGGLLRPVVLVVGLSLVFLPMFYVFPEIDLDWREVLPGVAVTAVGWTLLEVVFRFYVRLVMRSDAFGIVSSVLILATWLYFSGFVLLIGATVNAVLHGVDPAETG